MKREVWRDIPGYEGLYKVSNFGRVKSLNYRRTGKEKILSTYIIRTGYRIVNIYNKTGCKTFLVHRLVWEVFNGPIPDGLVINHKDQNRLNNAIENLMLCTQSENLRWEDTQERRLLKREGKYNTKWVIKLSLKNEILHFYPSVSQAGRETGIDRSCISACCRGKQKTAGRYTWKYAE